MKLKNYARAHEDFDRVIDADSENTDYLSSKAECLLDEGNIQESFHTAIELLEKALEQDETHFESISLLYQAYERMNRFEEAL